jgi:hypothetical protein
MTKTAPNRSSSGQTIRLNPLEWKPEHRAGLAVASAAGAAIGIALGFTRLRGGGFTYWLDRHSDGAIMWAIVGAVVVGAAVYCYRVFSAEAISTHLTDPSIGRV